MSYPGANGLSFADSDLEANADIKRLLHDATAEGFLLQAITLQSRLRAESP